MIKDTTAPAIHPNDLLTALLAEYSDVLVPGKEPHTPEQLNRLLQAFVRKMASGLYVCRAGMLHEQGPTEFSDFIGGFARVAEQVAQLFPA